jgi:F0F1-type ATP synthase delta subunit
MSQILDQKTLLELLDSNDLSESEKIALVEWNAKQIRRSELAALVVQAQKKALKLVAQIINHRAFQQVFSSPLLRSQH